MATEPTNFEVRIVPTRGLVRVDWRGIWQYRDLLRLLLWRDVSVKYRQTLLGPVWMVLQPILPTLVFTVIFGKVGGLPTEGLPAVLFYLANQVAWACFALNFTATSNVFANNASLFSKVYFPRLVVPLGAVAANFVALAMQLISFIGFYSFYAARGEIGAGGIWWGVIFLPVVALYLAMIGLGCGLWMSALTAKYRDLTQIAPVLVQVLMFGSPVIVPLSYFPPHWIWLVLLNPLAFPIELFRWCLLGQGTILLEHAVASAAGTLLICCGGVMLFSKAEKNFVDVA